MYVCMDGWMVRMLFKRAHSETTALSKPYSILKLQSVRKFLRKRLLFKKQKVTMALKTFYQI